MKLRCLTHSRAFIFLSTALLLSLPAAVSAEDFTAWNDLLGRSFEAKVVSVAGQSVRLENREGRQIDFPIADLMPSSRAQVEAWQRANQSDGIGAAAAEVAHKPSVFDSALDNSLVRLSGRRLNRDTSATKPQKYYLFYYTASWCPPCRQFTPQLVEWYKNNKNDNFELVLISSDRDEKAMTGYAVDASMPWPQLRFNRVGDFKKQFDHGVRGIPSVIVCDLDGKVLGNYRSRLGDLSKMVR